MNLKFVFKGVVSSALVVCLIAGTSIIPAFAESTESSSKDYAAKSGSHSGTAGFSTTYKLSSANGKNVNFWIKNTGNVSVRITINGDQKRTLAPGKSGHISAPVGSLSSEYKFKAVPTPNGGDSSIDYRIAQRD
ncbi:hypothetical protein GCM10010912_68940 [Paenibacillus albidus]|uniref:Uncharacterized protein n=1 Tax=Paenibacillus albidus TaxID=2041023 RepID=A0A917LDQ0_9BACL|nr:hypothetical protein [Paenibacillus albidus]GGG14732.1 hypothetical protein GCM10010912_68940 [Paenibacillus albidus]